MKFSLILGAIPLISAAVLPQITNAPSPALVKRDQKVLSDQVWTSTSGNVIMAITPTVIDVVTISASPVSTVTPWVSLDGSGIPSLVTPTVKDGTTISASPTPTDNSYPTPSFVPPVLRCFGDRVPSSDSETPGYPFCSPLNGTEMVVGETYWITWDPTYWGSDDVTQVKIELVAYPQTGTGSILLTTDYLSNTDAFYPLEIKSSFIRDGNGYFFITITPLTTSTTTAKNVGTKSGPLVRAISSEKDASSKIERLPSDSTTVKKSSSDNKTKKIVPAVILPVIFSIAIASSIIWYLRKQKKKALATGGLNTGSSEIQLSPSSTNGHDDQTFTTQTTAESANPFKETSRTVL